VGKSKFSEHQINNDLEAVEAGRTVRDVVGHEINEPPITNGRASTAAWKAQTFTACVSWKKKTGV